MFTVKISLKLKVTQLLLLLCCLIISTLASALDVVKTVNQDTNLIGWKITQNNFELELIQRSPQQTRSFFQARGFSPKIANDIATHCVFQTIVRNSEAENKHDDIDVSLKKWRITTVNTKQEMPLKLKEVWSKEWQDEEISTAAKVAFRWATLPTQQIYKPGGDFNWGMISFGPKPETIFDLTIVWKQDQQEYQAIIEQLQCPTDNDSNIN